MSIGRYVIVIGASTGGFEALTVIFAGLRQALHATVIVCQHIDKNARLNYQMIFRELSGFEVVEVEDKQKIRPGTIHFAPPGYHLYVEQDGYFGLSLDAPVNWSRPSIDVLFESAAKAYGKSLIGLILTGANADGALGMQKIKKLGGTTVVQNPHTARAAMMPRTAIKTNCVDFVLDLQDIPAFLARLVNDESNLHQGAV